MHGIAIASIVVGAFIGFIFVVVCCCILITCCGGRKNVHNQTGCNAPVVVTSATHTAPGGYPVAQMPVGATTTTYQTQVYAAPYPTQGFSVPTQMPMPMPMPGGQPPAPGIQPHMAPYPPMSAAASMNPPSYDMAVSGAGSGAPNQNSYEKQSPYNPNYSMQ